MLCLVLATGCAGEPREEEPPAALVAPTDRVTALTYAVTPGDVAAAGLPAFTVREPLTITSVEVGTSSGAAELLSARLSFGGAIPDAGTCTSVWPPAGLGTTEPADGAELGAGDDPSLVLFLRAPNGPAVVDEVVVRYTSGAARTELRWQAVRLDLRPAARSTCPKGGDWFTAD